MKERPKATSFMPDADELSGTEDMHNMDLGASAMDQDGERPGTGPITLFPALGHIALSDVEHIEFPLIVCHML